MTTDTTTRSTVSPVADIIETDHGYALTLDLPGVDEDSIDVHIDRNVLTISAHSAQREPENMRVSWREYRSQDYRRQFTLGRGIDRAGVTAHYRHGVLHLELPKAEEHRPQRITVNVN